MNHKDFLKFKEAAERIERECDTPAKAREFLTKAGFLDPDGQVSEKYRVKE